MLIGSSYSQMFHISIQQPDSSLLRIRTTATVHDRDESPVQTKKYLNSIPATINTKQTKYFHPELRTLLCQYHLIGVHLI